MSQQYNDYLFEHRHNLKLALDWLKLNMPELFKDLGDDVDIEQQVVFAHDASKDGPEEYDAYDKYWYGGNKSFAVVEAYDLAWLHHKHANQHHWQHWVLFNDDTEEGLTTLEMPMNYIIELICDWWSFGWAEGDLHSTYKWYNERKDYIKFHDKTRKIVEGIINKMEAILAQHEVFGTYTKHVPISYNHSTPYVRDDTVPNIGDSIAEGLIAGVEDNRYTAKLEVMKERRTE